MSIRFSKWLCLLVAACSLTPLFLLHADDGQALRAMAPNLLSHSGPFYYWIWSPPNSRPVNWGIVNCRLTDVSNGVFYATSDDKDGSLVQSVKDPDPGGRYTLEASMKCDVPRPAQISIRWWEPVTNVNVKPVYKRLNIPVEGKADEWRHLRTPFATAPAAAGFSVHVLFPTGADVSVAVSNVTVVPDVSVGRPSEGLVAGTTSAASTLTKIYVCPADSVHIKKAAFSLRRYLYELTGSLLPIMPLATDAQPKPGSIYLGTAALQAGTVTSDEMADIGSGGYLLKSSDGQVSLVGKNATGVFPGVFDLLARLGLKYYVPDLFIVDSRETYCVPPLLVKKTPTFEILSARGSGHRWTRLDKWLTCLGYTDEEIVVGDPYLHDVLHGWVHNAACLVNSKRYLESHPEYYAHDAEGNLKKASSLSCLHLCQSNSEVRRIALESVLRWMDLQPERKLFPITPGDGYGWCECAECRKLDPPRGDQTDRNLQFVNYIARGVREKHPDKRLCVSAYTSATEAPPVYTKPEPNVCVIYCTWSTDWKCRAHALCVRNFEGMSNVAGWTQLMPGRVYVFDYPWNVYADVDRMRYFAALGVKGYFTCGFRGEFIALQAYLIGRLQWDITMDVEAAITEFMQHYYGEKAAVFMQQYLDLTQDALAVTQRHRSGISGTLVPYKADQPTMLTDELADRAYVLLDQALAAAVTNTVAVERINREYYGILATDMIYRNPQKRKFSESELAAFATRLTNFIWIAKSDDRSKPTWLHMRGANQALRYTSMKEWLLLTTRIAITNDNNHWASDQKVEELLADPVGYLSAATAQESLSKGWKVAVSGIFGGQGLTEYRKRLAVNTRPASSGQDHAWAHVLIDKLSAGAYVLEVQAMDNDKPMPAMIELTVNGQSIFNGAVPFKKRAWSVHRFPIPENLLRIGKNHVDLYNRTSDDAWWRWQGVDVMPTSVEGVLIDEQQPLIKKYNWGWLMVSEISIIEDSASHPE